MIRSCFPGFPRSESPSPLPASVKAGMLVRFPAKSIRVWTIRISIMRKPNQLGFEPGHASGRISLSSVPASPAAAGRNCGGGAPQKKEICQAGRSRWPPAYRWPSDCIQNGSTHTCGHSPGEAPRTGGQNRWPHRLSRPEGQTQSRPQSRKERIILFNRGFFV